MERGVQPAHEESYLTCRADPIKCQHSNSTDVRCAVSVATVCAGWEYAFTVPLGMGSRRAASLVARGFAVFCLHGGVDSGAMRRRYVSMKTKVKPPLSLDMF